MHKNVILAIAVTAVCAAAVLILTFVIIKGGYKPVSVNPSPQPIGEIQIPSPVIELQAEPEPLPAVKFPAESAPAPLPSAAVKPAAQKKDIRSEDRDGDGNPDTWTEFKNDKIFQQAYDMNKDGIPDAKAHYNDQGQMVIQEMDKNLDGKIDAWFKYENGQLVGGKIDENGDGKPDKTFGK